MTGHHICPHSHLLIMLPHIRPPATNHTRSCLVEKCDNWLGLRQYNDDKSISKVVWVDKQFEKIVQANKRALKSIQVRAKVNERSSGDKDFDIPIGNLVLLRDHPEGWNKIQDDNKPDLFEVTGKHSDPNAFFIKP